MGLLRATFGLLMNRGRVTGGGSTITQQLAKNAFLNSGTIVYAKSEGALLEFRVGEEIFQRPNFGDVFK